MCVFVMHSIIDSMRAKVEALGKEASSKHDWTTSSAHEAERFGPSLIQSSLHKVRHVTIHSSKRQWFNG